MVAGITVSAGRMVLWLACWLVRTGRPQTALRWFDSAVAWCQGDDLTKALYRRALTLGDEGRLLAARTDLQRVLQQDPGFGEAVQYLVRIDTQLGYTWSVWNPAPLRTLKVDMSRYEEAAPAVIPLDEPEAWYNDAPTLRVAER